EDAECAPVPVEVAPDGVEGVVATGDELLHHRRELLGVREGGRDVVERVAAERLPPKTVLEADRVLRLDEDRKADLLRGRTRLVRGRRVARVGSVDPELRGLLELRALALHSFEQVPRGERCEHRQVVEVLRKDVERVVVRREVDHLAERTYERHEACPIRAWIRTEEPLGVPRAEAEGARPVVDGEDADPGAPERTDRSESVDPTDVDDSRRNAHAAILPTAGCVRSGHVHETSPLPGTKVG